MNSCFPLCLLSLFLPAILFSQPKPGKDSVYYAQAPVHTYKHQGDSTFSVLFNTSVVFTTAKDQHINNFLTKYGYRPAQQVPMGIRIELAAIPFNSKMMFSLSGGTIISRQDIVSSNFTLGAYRRFYENKHFQILAGAGIGKHGDRIILNGQLPPGLDSIANQYNKVLSLHRTGFLMEPAARFFWYPVQTKKIQLGLFAGVAYDFSFNSEWKLGYYNQNGQFTSFKRIHRPTNVQSQKEFGWVFSSGLSFCFKFD